MSLVKTPCFFKVPNVDLDRDMFITLTPHPPFNAKDDEGILVVDPNQIQSMERWKRGMFSTRVTMKSVISGFDDEDKPYPMQEVHEVQETPEQILELIDQAKQADK